MQLTGLKGSAAIVLVPDTTGHIQRSYGVHALTGDLHNISAFNVTADPALLFSGLSSSTKNDFLISPVTG